MPFFADQSREQLRRVYIDAWQKHLRQEPLQPLQAQIAAVIALHPEYHALFDDAQQALAKDWQPQDGATNPFLHMGLHLAIREQLATNRPEGIQPIYRALLTHLDSAHTAEHRMIDCLAEALWQAQRAGRPPDETAYLAKLRNLLK